MTGTSWADLKGNASEGPTPVPAGPYDVFVEGAEATSTKTGKVMFKIRLKIYGGPYDGKTIFTNQTVSPESPAALGMFFRFMEAFGIDVVTQFPGDPESTKHAIAAALVGRYANVTVAIKTDDYGTKNEVKSAKPYGGVAAAVPAAPAAPVPPAPPAAPVPPAAPPAPPAPAAAPAPPVPPAPVPAAPAAPF